MIKLAQSLQKHCRISVYTPMICYGQARAKWGFGTPTTFSPIEVPNRCLLVVLLAPTFLLSAAVTMQVFCGTIALGVWWC